MPKLARKTSAPADSKGTRGTPPVSGNSLDGAEVALLVALAAVAEALADGLATVLAEPLAGAEAPGIAVASAVGLAIMLSSIPMPFIPPSFIPRLPAPW